jgi:hypothetical protein
VDIETHVPGLLSSLKFDEEFSKLLDTLPEFSGAPHNIETD